MRGMRAGAAPCPDWLLRIRAGHFDAIPEGFSWGESSEFAYLIDGYTLSQWAGRAGLATLANQRFDQAQESGRWSGTAAELWCCLFFEHRRYRHMDEGEPTGCDLDVLNRLCATLRERLQTLSDDDHDTLLVFICRSHQCG